MASDGDGDGDGACKTLLIFDFDWSLIDCNSDTWVVDKLGASDVMAALRPTMSWTALMDRMMTELHIRGKTVSDIAISLRAAPLHPEMIQAINFATENGSDLYIVSDANSFFIQIILEAYNLITYFKEIHTNPAHLDNFGVLRILPYHSSNVEPHGCVHCPPNMCKGVIIDKIRIQHLASTKLCTIYVGDGSGDYCPSLRLTKKDHVFARAGFPLLKQIKNNPELLRAKVHEWSFAEDLEVSLTYILRHCHSVK